MLANRCEMAGTKALGWKADWKEVVGRMAWRATRATPLRTHRQYHHNGAKKVVGVRGHTS